MIKNKCIDCGTEIIKASTRCRPCWMKVIEMKRKEKEKRKVIRIEVFGLCEDCKDEEATGIFYGKTLCRGCYSKERRKLRLQTFHERQEAKEKCIN